MSSPLPAGTKLGRYQIRSLIGTGGMGEVYLAEDTLLRRPTAIKLLTGDYSNKEERLHRFEREAYAASSLNHPNIVTIFEIGADHGHHFIATEFVEGESLRHHARNVQMDFREIVEIAIQIASALSAAHEAGIIHRDIKPENIMLRKDGYVKVLDFGLAKLADESFHNADAEAATQLMIKTEPGRIMGTIDYMSPEQARGRDVDHRSDLFSLGIVLYELTSGAKPFSGDTKSDVLAAVLTAEVVPMTHRRAGIPVELNRIVSKCLKKNQDDRYQTAKELLIDLKSLRQDMDVAAKLGSSVSVSQTEPVAYLDIKTAPQAGQTYPSTISELFIKEVKSHPKRSFAFVAVVALAVIAGGIGLYKLVQLATRTDSFQNMRLTKLTSSGDVSFIAVAVSPDGKYIAYGVIEAGSQSLWIRHVETSSNLQLVAPRDVDYTGLTFSPDGSYLYFTAEERQLSSLYRVPVLGGPSTKLIDDARGPVSFASNGKVLAFRRNATASQLLIANEDGSAEKVLATRQPKETWLPPAWSPTDALIVAGYISLQDNKVRLVEVDMSGNEKPLPTEPFMSLTSICWVGDGTGLVMAGRDLDTKLYQIWYISYPDGKSRRITNDLSSYAGVSVTADGKSLVSVQSARVSSLWTAINGDAESATKITSDTGKDEGLSGLSWTADGRIVHTARISGVQDLWVINKDGSSNTQVTRNAGRNFYPTVTPDGRYIVFISDRSGRNDLWRVDIDGRNPLQITNVGPVLTSASISPDSKWIIYGATVDKIQTIWKSSINGGDPVQLTKTNSMRPLVTPNGATFVCRFGDSGPNGVMKLAEISIDGGEPKRLIDLPNVMKSGLVKWNSTGDALIYRESKNRVDNLWSQTLDASPPKQLTNFKSDQIFEFEWSRNGKDLVLARGRNGSDVVMITNFR